MRTEIFLNKINHKRIFFNRRFRNRYFIRLNSKWQRLHGKWYFETDGLFAFRYCNRLQFAGKNLEKQLFKERNRYC